MLRAGLTGGIGSGKSTVSAQLRGLGAVVVDADLVAREVVGPGTEGLAAILKHFGDFVLTQDGTLDRARLARVAFAEDAARRDLETITHPRIAQRTAELIAAAPEDALVVHDVPLLVEKHLGAAYHLVVVVDADEEVRLRRLVRDRGMSEQEARARMAAQTTEEQRRAEADVWLDNGRSPQALAEQVERLWRERLVPFNDNLRLGERSHRPEHLRLAEPDPTWPAQAARLGARILRGAGGAAVRVDHIGSTSVPGLVAKDVLDLQLGVRSLTEADDPLYLSSMAAAGFPRADGIRSEHAKDGQETWPKRMHGNADPRRVAHIHVREVGSPGWRWALLFRDWLRADGQARQEYAGHKLALAAQGLSTTAYTQAKEPWFDEAAPRAEAWAGRTGWRPV